MYKKMVTIKMAKYQAKIHSTISWGFEVSFNISGSESQLTLF
jgi:hypothetical protein